MSKRKFSNHSTPSQKRQKRSEVIKDNIPFPADALKEIEKSFHELAEGTGLYNEVIQCSYDPFVETELKKAKELLERVGFVKLNMNSKALIDSSSGRTVRLSNFNHLFYSFIKTAFSNFYKMDISKEIEVLDVKKGRKGKWPTSLNVGKIGPIHTLSGDSTAQNHTNGEVVGVSKDPINQSIISYYIKAHFCYDAFRLLLGERELLCSVEPATMVFPGNNLHQNNSSTEEEDSEEDKVVPNDESDTCNANLSPLTRLVYAPAVLSKPQTEDPEILGFDVVKNIPYCGVLAITSGDPIGLIPSAHHHFETLLKYMQKTRHTDKRTIYASTPPNEFELKKYLIQIPLKSGEYLIHDRRIPTKINSISKKFQSTKVPLIEKEKGSMEPFVGLNVSFFRTTCLNEKEVALRSLSFMQQILGSGKNSLKVFGHVENMKRRGTPVVVDKEDLGDVNTNPITVSDSLVRKIIGIDKW